MRKVEKSYDIVVIGGGLAGVSVAIAAARHFAKVALLQDRPVLGGNASSEIRMCVVGADNHGTRPNARETGIVEEFLLHNRVRNVHHSFSIADTILWEMCRFQDNLDLYLNTRATAVISDNNKITNVVAHQITTEKEFNLSATIFVDCTGDGSIAEQAGAEYMSGRESRLEFDEPDAPEEHDDYVLGNSLMFKSINTGVPVKFIKPHWANTYTEEDLKFRGHYDGAKFWKSKYGIDSGYWWIELGGGELNIIDDGEEIRDELLKVLYGVWDHIKNCGDHKAENYDLDWVQFLPGKRESRRILGDYVLTQNDVLCSKLFKDEVAYGGWPMDMHIIRGMKSLDKEPTHYIEVPDLYGIPYKCYYSKNIENLMMAGRCISVSHMAHGSTRVMGTCAVGGQAVGIAAAMAIEKNCSPRNISDYIEELQQKLLKDDCFLPHFKNNDCSDKAPKCKSIIASSFCEGCEPANVINGISRTVGNAKNCWISESLKDNQELTLTFDEPIETKGLILRFDSNLSKEISIYLFKAHLEDQIPGVPPQIIKDFDIVFKRNGGIVHTYNVADNFMRICTINLDKSILADEITLKINSTHGSDYATIYEVRVY